MCIVGEMTESLIFFHTATWKTQVFEALLFFAEIHAEGLPVSLMPRNASEGRRNH